MKTKIALLFLVAGTYLAGGFVATSQHKKLTESRVREYFGMTAQATLVNHYIETGESMTVATWTPADNERLVGWMPTASEVDSNTYFWPVNTAITSEVKYFMVVDRYLQTIHNAPAPMSMSKMRPGMSYKWYMIINGDTLEGTLMLPKKTWSI